MKESMPGRNNWKERTAAESVMPMSVNSASVRHGITPDPADRNAAAQGRRRRRVPIPVMLAAVLVLLFAFFLSGCDTEPKTLEDYLSESPSAQQQIKDSLDGLNNSDMDVAVSYDQNRIIITCDMKSTYKKKVLKTMKKAYRKYMKKNLTKPMEKAVASIEQETGISGVSILVTINNGNGKEMWSQLYPLELAEQEAAEQEATGKDGDEQSEADQETTEQESAE